MAEYRLKFRCYRCNQLLSTSPKRVGKEIACPRCKAELVVPQLGAEPEAAAANADTGEGMGKAGAARRQRQAIASADPGIVRSPMEDLATAIPEDLVALRPEDIRVEAEFVDLVITTDEPGTSTPVPNAPVQPDESPFPELQESVPAEPSPRLTPEMMVGPADDPGRPSVDAAMNAVLPAITIDPPTILPPDREIRHVREVVLQPSTVLAWSLLVLLSIPMAFISGLLIGHFLWK